MVTNKFCAIFDDNLYSPYNGSKREKERKKRKNLNFADVKIDRLHSLLSCSETKCIIVLQMCTLIASLIPLHCVKW